MCKGVKLCDNKFGLHNIILVHLNDSSSPINSKKDRHANIGKGYIGYDGLQYFVEFCNKNNIPIILETPTNNNLFRKKELEWIKQIIH